MKALKSSSRKRSPSRIGAVREPAASPEPSNAQARHVLDQMDIRMIETRDRRRDGETCAIATIQQIIDRYGVGHATLVLRTVSESEGNARQLIAPVLWAISDIVSAHPSWASTTQWLDQFDEIDLAMVVNEARLNRTACPLRSAIATLLHAILRPTFDPLGRVRLRPSARRVKHDERATAVEASACE